MSNRYKFHDNSEVYFVSFSVVDWIDVFTRNEYREVVVDSIKYCIENKGLRVHAWVIMSNHVHLLLSAQEHSGNSLSAIMRDMKKYTAMQLIKMINENPQESRKDWLLYRFEKAGKYNSNNINFQFWRQDNHPIQMQDAKQCYNTTEYIHNNPVKAGWARTTPDFPWSSAIDYNNGTGLIPIVLLDFVYVKTV